MMNNNSFRNLNHFIRSLHGENEYGLPDLSGEPSSISGSLLDGSIDPALLDMPTLSDRVFGTDFTINENNPYSDLSDVHDQLIGEMDQSAESANLTYEQWLDKVMSYNADQAKINRDFQQTSADKAMEFSAAEAEKNRQWQEMMSNTSFQRAMQDLEAAGLNPKLVAQLSGASTPSGGFSSGVSAGGSSASTSASSSHMAQRSDAVMNALSSVFSALRNAENVSSTNVTNLARSILSLFDFF